MSTGPGRRLAESYDAAFQATMSVAPAAADDPAALAAAAEALPPAARALLDLVLLTVGPDLRVPERLRPRLEAAGEALWRAALLLPRTTTTSTGLHPQHYAGACTLNPAARGLPVALVRASVVTLDARPQAAPGEARVDALVLAAALEASPLPLNQDGSLRRDADRRLYAELGDEPARWALALAVARATGRVRPLGGRLQGFPDATARPLVDLTAVLDAVGVGGAASVLLRVAGDGWLALGPLLDALRTTAREILHSPRAQAYPDGRAWDDRGWAAVEEPLFRAAADTLHRLGGVDALRDAGGVTHLRRAAPRPPVEDRFLLTPDGLLYVPASGLPAEVYGRVCRVARYQGGAGLHQHRLSREGVQLDLAHGNHGVAAFLEAWSRTGVPPSVRDQLREWERASNRITLHTGVDLWEDEAGALHVGPPPARPERVVDYADAPRGRFAWDGAQLIVPDEGDTLPLRSTLARVAQRERRERGVTVWRLRAGAVEDEAWLLDRLRAWYGGELPSAVELHVLAQAGRAAVQAGPAVLLHLPGAVGAALRRDPVAAALLTDWLDQERAVLGPAAALRLQARAASLGIRWDERPAGPGGVG